jgi:hypothetical protein
MADPQPNASEETKMKSFLGFMSLAMLIVGLATQSAFADGRQGGRPFAGSFAVSFTGTLNTAAVSYCGGTALPTAIEAHGNGSTSLGTFSFTLFKTGGGGLFHGCLTLTAPNGDILEATYDAGSGATNSNNFAPATGGLTFTGGTGRFKNASGSATFSAIFNRYYPGNSFAGGGPANVPVQGMAFYEIEGTLHRGKN